MFFFILLWNYTALSLYYKWKSEYRTLPWVTYYTHRAPKGIIVQLPVKIVHSIQHELDPVNSLNLKVINYHSIEYWLGPNITFAIFENILSITVCKCFNMPIRSSIFTHLKYLILIIIHLVWYDQMLFYVIFENIVATSTLMIYKFWVYI